MQSLKYALRSLDSLLQFHRLCSFAETMTLLWTSSQRNSWHICRSFRWKIYAAAVLGLDAVAASVSVTSVQLALAWLLHPAPNILLTPNLFRQTSPRESSSRGAQLRSRLRVNAAPSTLRLSGAPSCHPLIESSYRFWRKLQRRAAAVLDEIGLVRSAGVHVLYKRPEIPANISNPASVVSATCRKQKGSANTGSIPVSATNSSPI
jgi:hypothetical protein